jgi:eukaryotic-like serine/threonine-protein kinase
LAFAIAGDNSSAAKLIEDLKKNAEDTMIQNFAIPTIRAHMEMNDGHPEKSIELLRPALGYEFGMADFGSLQPAYPRGLAYLKLRKGAEAAREFQKLIENRGLIYDSILGPLAGLQLARAEILSGNRDAARTHYQDFLAL